MNIPSPNDWDFISSLTGHESNTFSYGFVKSQKKNSEKIECLMGILMVCHKGVW